MTPKLKPKPATKIDWPAVKAQDAKLVKASEALAELRWTYTLGATPKVSFAKYARETGVGEHAVRKYATAWEIRTAGTDSDDPRGPDLSIEKALNRATYSADRADVIEAVADARGISPATVRGTGHMDEVRRIEQSATEKANENGSTVKEEAVKLATSMAKGRATSERKAASGKVGALSTLVFLDSFNDARLRIKRAYEEWESKGKRVLTPEEAESFTDQIVALRVEIDVIEGLVQDQITDDDIEALLG